jgi:hypothetical protein
MFGGRLPPNGTPSTNDPLNTAGAQSFDMPFKTNYGHELFNDCLFFRDQARNAFLDKRNKIFEARREVRASFISLWSFWEYWINEEIYSLTQKQVMRIKGVERLGDDGESSIQLKSLLRLSFDNKLDLFVLLSGIDVRKERVLMREIEEMKTTRNELLHPSFTKPFIYEEKFIERIDQGIDTTRRFFSVLIGAGRYLPTTFSYLQDETPKDLVSIGYGYARFDAHT